MLYGFPIVCWAIFGGHLFSSNLEGWDEEYCPGEEKVEKIKVVPFLVMRFKSLISNQNIFQNSVGWLLDSVIQFESAVAPILDYNIS